MIPEPLRFFLLVCLASAAGAPENRPQPWLLFCPPSSTQSIMAHPLSARLPGWCLSLEPHPWQLPLAFPLLVVFF
ncbi:hypothetical protein V8C44DRAFT_323086 [Trichoderma aethiopicum]